MTERGDFLEIDPGTVVANRYRITRPLGRGGMGEVFAAENIRTGRPVAVKLLRAESKQKSSAVARFRREARAAGSINSDHVTQVLDVEEDQEHGIVLVFELLEGESLIERLKRTGPIPFDELHFIVEQVWIGLADAHKAGIIHRDLKPSNVFLEKRPDGSIRVKILDFGISKVPKEMGGETLTEMGQSLGTFSFMPPEQIGKAKTVDHRADIYAGATLIYQAMSGQLPYAARNILVMVEMKSKTDPRKLTEAMGEPVDPRLEAFLARGLARDPDARFQSALDALNAWRDLRPRTGTSGEMQAVRPASISGTSAAVSPTSSPASPRTDTRAPGAVPSLASMSEPTSDSSAATLAMQLPTSGPLSRGGTSIMEMPRSIAALKGTVPMSNAADLMAQANANHAQSGGAASQDPRASGAMQVPSSAPQQAAPQQAMPSQGLMQTPAPLPRLFDESTSNSPPSQDKTTVYRPARSTDADAAKAAAAALARLPAASPATNPRPGSQAKRSALPYVLGAIAFALVGFSIVAVVLQYLKTGALPWH